jgi:hypothetical protein
MVKRRVLRPLPVWDEPSVLAALAEVDVKLTHAMSLWNWLTRNPRARTWEDVRWQEMQSIPQRAKDVLTAEFALYTSTVERAEVAPDGSTTKLIIRLQDGHAVEAVQIHHENRRTLCISSQIGCAMGCSFCATGTMGILGDLLAGEIIEQLQHALALAPCRNVVYMGMGEPLNNYKAVLDSARAMIDRNLFALAGSRVTVSTVGIVPRIRQLARDEPRVNLALSLHAPTQAQREGIMPAARSFPLPVLMDAMKEYAAACRPGKEIMIGTRAGGFVRARLRSGLGCGGRTAARGGSDGSAGEWRVLAHWRLPLLLPSPWPSLALLPSLARPRIAHATQSTSCSPQSTILTRTRARSARFSQTLG